MSPAFSISELKRVGTAATMIVVCGTLIIITITMMLGHYSSLSHCGPKAVLDGTVIALLIGRRGRWRCLALLGTVYGLVLLLQVGLFYLLPVMMIAGSLAAAAGRAVNTAHRSAAIFIAAACYELLAGFGAPIKIYFGTGGHTEPFLWGLWLAEWPLRIIGAMVGVWLAGRWLDRRQVDQTPQLRAKVSVKHFRTVPVSRGVWAAAQRIIACALACTVPMFIESPIGLCVIALIFLAYALAMGMRFQILKAMAGLLWGWLIFGVFSYAWNHDWDRVLDMLRTLVLRFMPMTLASIVLVLTARPVDVLRLLRRMRISAAVLIPLSIVIRSVPHSRRMIQISIEQLRASGEWKSPLSLLRRPRVIVRGLVGPQIKQWASELADDPGEPIS